MYMCTDIALFRLLTRLYELLPVYSYIAGLYTDDIYIYINSSRQTKR